MAQATNIKAALLVGAITTALVVEAAAQGRPGGGRSHIATQVEDLQFVSASQSKRGAQVVVTTRGNKRLITANGIPSHKVGRFPNRGNPHRITVQSYRFSMPLSPKPSSRETAQRGMLFGVAVNGVPFDPGTAEVWRGDRRSGWNYEALGGAVPLGLDTNYGYVQPTGAYHYHGLPVGLMQQLGWVRSVASPLIGWAADGFPIYALTAEMNGRVVEMTSSYQLKSGNRPGGASLQAPMTAPSFRITHMLRGLARLMNVMAPGSPQPNFRKEPMPIF